MAAPLEWTLGLKNQSTGKYLTQETFGFRLNANGAGLKKKQTLTLISTDGGVHLRTHLDRFLYGDKDGNFKGDAENPSAETLWQIHPQPDGAWAFQSAAGFFLEGTADKLSCFAKEVSKDGLYVVHLAMHPQVNVYNVMRKRYVHYVPEDKQLQCNEDVPWGEDALLTFVFFSEHQGGRYGFMSCNGQYLTDTGELVQQPNANCMFLLGFHDNQVSFRNEAGEYLSCVGGKGVLKVQKSKVSKDELFVIQDSEFQFVIVDDRGRHVSNRSSNEVKADQSTVTDLERFQLEVQQDGSVFIKNSRTKYWEIADDGVIFADNTSPNPNCRFQVVWKGTRASLIGPNGKGVTVAANGALKAIGSTSDAHDFTWTLINRPEAVMRGPYGFVGIKGASGRVEVNRSVYDIFYLESNNGAYSFRTKAGQYWSVGPDGVEATSSQPVAFHLEFASPSKVLIKHADSGRYLQGEQNGGFRATGTEANANTLWEF